MPAGSLTAFRLWATTGSIAIVSNRAEMRTTKGVLNSQVSQSLVLVKRIEYEYEYRFTEYEYEVLVR